MKMFKNQLHHALKSMTALERSWENLDSHERETVEQVAQETGFDELGNFEEVVNKFKNFYKNFYQQMQRTTVIDGYQVWIDDNNNLNIKRLHGHVMIARLEGLAHYIKDNSIGITRETMLKILAWYIEEV